MPVILTIFVILSVSRSWWNVVLSNSWDAMEPLRRSLSEPTSEDLTDAKRLLGEVENAFIQGACGKPSLSPSSKTLQMLEKSVFSSEMSSSKLLADFLDESIVSTSKDFIEFLTKEILRSQKRITSFVIFISSKETATSPVYVKIFRNYTKPIYTWKEYEETVEALQTKLKKKCNEVENSFSSDILWTRPYSNCVDQVFLEAFHVVYRCNGNESIDVKNYVAPSFDLNEIDINQCDNDDEVSNPFAATNLCPDHSICRPIKNYGFRNGGYSCTCQLDNFSDQNKQVIINGSTIIKKDNNYLKACKGCMEEEAFCSNFFALPDAIVVAGLSAHIIIMIAMFLPGLLVAKLRKTKTLSFNFWQLYEVMLGGGLLIYLSVVVDYMDISVVSCISGQWLREIGFVTLYSSMMLKMHGMRVECRSRQAQRVLLRDKDLIRYLILNLLIVTWQLLSWTVINVEHMVDDIGSSKENHANVICDVGTWHHVVEIEEFVALVSFVYLCCSVSPPPSFAIEFRAITFSLVNEAILSAAHNVLKYFVISNLTHRGHFLMSVIRCHLTVSINMVVLMSIKLWQARTSSHVASSCRRKDGRKDGRNDGSSLNSKEGVKPHRPLKSQTSKQTQEHTNDMNLSGLNPEDVKAELKRLYRQLEIYKARSSRKDISHNIKKLQTMRKQGTRRFSLYNFHQSRKHHSNLADKNKCLDDCTEKEHSRITPEESTNSCEVWNLMSTLP